MTDAAQDARSGTDDRGGFAEALLLRAGCAYQQVTDWHRRVPPIAPAVEGPPTV